MKNLEDIRMHHGTRQEKDSDLNQLHSLSASKQKHRKTMSELFLSFMIRLDVVLFIVVLMLFLHSCKEGLLW